MPLSRTLTWLLRAAWITLPVVAGPSLGDALEGAGTALRSTASVGLWAVWALTLLATLAPRPAGLVAVRIVAPAAVVVASAAAAGGHASAAALGATSLAALVAFAPEVGTVFVNGAAYGDERRHLLRVPGVLLLGPVEMAWAVVVAGAASGPLLLAAGEWVPGAAASVAGIPLAAAAARALHGLALRWLVFVPAGVVLHDHLALSDPMLFRRQSVDRLGPAPAVTDALDLTKGALGLALELALTDDVDLPVARPRQRLPETRRTRRLLFTPTRPGAVVADARARRVGRTQPPDAR